LETYGVDQAEIIGTFSYEEMVYLLLFKRRATTIQRDLLRGVIVSHISHGITGQSTLAVRMAADCGTPFVNAFIAGFSTGAGAYHQGGLESAMRELQDLANHPESELESIIRNRVAKGERIIGFGHRFFKKEILVPSS
jgi:citrate synthase